MIKNNWGRVFSVGIYIELHIVDSSCSYTVLWDYLSLGSDNHPPVSLLSSSFLLPCLTLFSWGWCLGEASKNSSGEKASSLQQHGDKCQLASLLGYPSSVPLVVISCSSLDDDLFFYQFLFPHLLSLEVWKSPSLSLFWLHYLFLPILIQVVWKSPFFSRFWLHYLFHTMSWNDSWALLSFLEEKKTSTWLFTPPLRWVFHNLVFRSLLQKTWSVMFLFFFFFFVYPV